MVNFLLVLVPVSVLALLEQLLCMKAFVDMDSKAVRIHQERMVALTQRTKAERQA